MTTRITRESVRRDSVEMMRFDPITRSPLENPVIDPCGHTFNKSTVEQLEKPTPTTVRCPFSRKAFAIEKLIPNLYAENVIKHMQEEEKRASHSNNSSSSSSSSSTTSTTTASIIATHSQTEVLETLTEELCRMREEHMTARTAFKKEFEALRSALLKLQIEFDLHNQR
jgi:hypothetical protein